MKKLIVALLVLSLVLSFAPVYAAGSYVLKGIEDGERIPVGESSYSFTRTLTILDATARPRFLTPATDFEKAEFFIDGEKVATVTDNPCQWELTLTDLNEHTLTATVTDINGGTQDFGPYTYRAVQTIDHSSSFTEYFEGDEGDPFPTKLRIPKIDSKNNPVYSAVKGGDGTALKLTMTSMNNTTIETAQDIFVPEQGFVTYDLDVYCTSGSEYLKIYLRSRNAGGFPMKDGDWEMLPNLTMEQLGEKNKWHHISFVFDTSRRRFCGFVDGLEVDRGDMGDTPGRTIYFHIATQSYTTGDLYFDNLEIMSKIEREFDEFELVDKDTKVSAVVVNRSEETRNLCLYCAEYDGNLLKNIKFARTTVAPGGIWQKTVRTVPDEGNKVGVYLLGPNMLPLADPLIYEIEEEE